MPVHSTSNMRGVFFIGRSTERERLLVDAKHHYDVLHITHGVRGEELVKF